MSMRPQIFELIKKRKKNNNILYSMRILNKILILCECKSKRLSCER